MRRRPTQGGIESVKTDSMWAKIPFVNVVPSMIVTNLVSPVSPVLAPSGQIFYLDYQYNSI